MAVDRNTIVTLCKKCESNFWIAKKLHIQRETVWKVIKMFKETGETCNRPGQFRTRTGRTKRLVKNTREKLRRNSRCSAAKMSEAAGISQASMRWILKIKKTSEPILTKCRKDKNFQPLLNLLGLTDVNTFWISWKTARCQISCSLMRRNLTFSNAEITKMIEFGVEMDQWKAAELADARIHFLWWCGRQSQPLGDLHSFLYPQEWNWTASVTFRTFWKLNSFPGHVSTLMVHLGLFNNSDSAPSHGSKMTRRWIQRSLAKMNGSQAARIWTLLTFLCGQFLRVRFAELFMIR